MRQLIGWMAGRAFKPGAPPAHLLGFGAGVGIDFRTQRDFDDFRRFPGHWHVSLPVVSWARPSTRRQHQREDN